MTIKSILGPVLIIVVALALAALMVVLKPEPEIAYPAKRPLLVDVLAVLPRSLTVTVRVQGTVQARRQTSLVNEVRGKVIAVSDNFSAGGFFEAGDVLLRLDDRDYQVRLEQAQALVAQAKSALAQEKGRVYVARQEWGQRSGREKISQAARELALRAPQLQEAQARLKSALAGLRQAQADLERTVIRAPYDGLLTSKRVDIGQYINAGSILGALVSVDAAEVRLAIPESKLAYLLLPDQYRGQTLEKPAKVTLHYVFDGEVLTWEARLIRTEGVLDERSRSLFVVAELVDPYGIYGSPARGDAPLRFGMFVQAEIEGRRVDGVIPLPRGIIRPGNVLWVVDGDSRLRERKVDILRSDGPEIYVRGGLAGGERVCLTSVGPVLPGTLVSVVSTRRQSVPAEVRGDEPRRARLERREGEQGAGAPARSGAVGE